jgi:hypothetical protein
MDNGLIFPYPQHNAHADNHNTNPSALLEAFGPTVTWVGAFVVCR